MRTFVRFISVVVFVILMLVALAMLIDEVMDYYNQQRIETLEELEQRY